jgi:hypothetical protein
MAEPDLIKLDYWSDVKILPRTVPFVLGRREM